MAKRAVRSAHDRVRAIEQNLQARGSVRIDRLAADLAVSEMTIRRDLDELQALGVARRVRGGAVAVGPEQFAQRHRLNAKAKGRIAEKLLELLPSTGCVAFDASTTLYRLATRLEGARDLVVLTNGVDTFQALMDKQGITPTLTGGVREPRTGSLVGPVATRGSQGFLCDVFVCSAAAVDPEVGSSEASLAEAEVKRTLGELSARVILAVDAGKLGTRAQARMFPLDTIEVMVTDLDPGNGKLDAYRARVALR